ncbi:uncharacterized protein LOC135845258 [Planococcus citri]|uniref:uncharacterized protein LOC135845258 n=1 Tax=Planococcus citri TaxID=170843 RepID=UPI0031F8EC9B
MYLYQKLLLTIIIPVLVVSSFDHFQDGQGQKVEVPPEAEDFNETTTSGKAYLETFIEAALNERFENESNKYWSVQEARKVIMKYDGDYDPRFAKIIDQQSYTFSNGTYNTITPDTQQIVRVYKWRTNVEDFSFCCHFAAEDIRRTISILDKNPTIETPAALTNLRNAEEFIWLVFEFLNDTIPYDTASNEYIQMSKWNHSWNNWYGLSINFPNVLAYYMMVPFKVRQIKSSEILTNIHKIIKTPYRSLSANRDGANAISMFGPWLIGQIYTFNCDEKEFKTNILERSAVYDNITSDISLRYRQKHLEKGLHRDGTYISHATVLGFGYLKLLSSRITLYAYAFDKTLKYEYTPPRHWNRAAALLLHQHVARGPPGILNRGSSFISETNSAALLGCKIMPLARILRVNAHQCRFFARGVTAGLGFFEADKSSDLYSQYWVQSRIPYHVNSSSRIPEFKYAYGLIFSTDHEDYIQLKSRATTTDIYYPTNDSWCLVGSFGWNAADRQEFLRQNYSINEYGKYRVYEYIRYAHHVAKQVVINLEIDNRQGDKELRIRYSLVEVDPHVIDDTYKNNLRVLKIPIGTVARLRHIVNLESCKISTTVLDESNMPKPMWSDIDTKRKILFSYEYLDRNDTWILNTKDNVVSSSVSGVYSCAAPLPDELEEKYIRNNKFVFEDLDRNTYIRAPETSLSYRSQD